MNRYQTSLTLSERDFVKFTELKEQGFGVIDIFRRGLYQSADLKVIKTPEQAKKTLESIGTYGCGCSKEDNKVLCPKHHRV